jgi:VanZ family protein
VDHEVKNEGRAVGPAEVLNEYFPLVLLIPTLAYCGVIFYLSSIPSLKLPPPFPHFDKVVHFCEYGGLSVLIVAGLRRARHKFSAGMRIAVPVLLCALYGLSDEIHQLFVVGRTFDLLDLAADAAGAAVAAGVLLFVIGKVGSKGLRNKGGTNG